MGLVQNDLVPGAAFPGLVTPRVTVGIGNDAPTAHAQIRLLAGGRISDRYVADQILIMLTRSAIDDHFVPAVVGPLHRDRLSMPQLKLYSRVAWRPYAESGFAVLIGGSEPHPVALSLLAQQRSKTDEAVFRSLNLVNAVAA